MTLCYEGVRAHTLEACHAARVKARALLVAGREQAELDVLRELYDATIQSHDNDEKGHAYVVKKREEFFAAVPGFPTTWKAKNFDGSTFRLADQRGKVLVLFFWTTGCGYNVLAAPQICQLAADYQGTKDVAIVGMFVRRESADDEEAKARHLIAKCFQGFPHLEGKDVTALYGFQQYDLGYPSLLVLDQAGRVQEVHDCSADLAQRIRKIVDDLRSKPPEKKN
jgi:thiol-disulfide isomerase/thioredoxin